MGSNNRKKGTLEARRSWQPYILLAPALFLVIIFMGYPLLYSVKLSMMNYNIVQPGNIYFNHFANYKKLFTNPDFFLVLTNSIIWVVCIVSVQALCGMALAMLLKFSSFRLRGIYQGIVFLPWAISGFLIGMIFKWIFSENGGLVNQILVGLGAIEQPISWMGTVEYSKVTPIISMIWYGIPFFAIMFLAALQSIPNDTLESADVDGATPTQKFLLIMLPYIKPTVVVTILLRVIWVFNSSDTIYVTTKGGPANSSNILSYYVFNQAYSSMDFGYGAAAGIFMMMVLGAYALLYLKVTKYE